MTATVHAARASGNSSRATVDVVLADAACVLSLRGEVDMANAGDVFERLRHCFDASGHRPLILDLSGLTFLGSAGIRVLIRLYYHVHACGSQMIAARPTPTVRTVLDITGLSEILQLA